MLQQLIAREIESNPAVARRMKLAILPGFNVLVPQGKLVGGTFRSTPLCSAARARPAASSAGSASARGTSPPPGAIFGYRRRPGMTVACINPARPGSRSMGTARQLLVHALDRLPVPGGPISWSTRGPAADALCCAPRAWPPAAASIDGPRGYLSSPHQRRPQGQAHRPHRRRSRDPRHVPARLGHAPRRHGAGPGRPRPDVEDSAHRSGEARFACRIRLARAADDQLPSTSPIAAASSATSTISR